MSSDRKPRVILTEKLADEPVEYLERYTDLVSQSDEDAEAFEKELAEAEGVVVRTYTIVNDAWLDKAPKLKVIGRAGVGLDNIDVAACKRHGVRVVFTPIANTQAVVEYVWALILDAVRPRPYLEHYVPPPVYHQHRKNDIGRQLDELVLGVLGMGNIGRRIAEVGHAIGMRVLYNDLLNRNQLALPDDEPSEFVDKATLWAEADVLSIHVDGRAENRNLIDANVLAQLKPGCLIINAARGMMIDEQALADWASRVKDQGGVAVLDVQDPEPPADDSPLFGIENIRLLPHLAARTHRAMSNMAWVVRDVVKVLEGEQPTWEKT